jgi:hypothetical protein
VCVSLFVLSAAALSRQSPWMNRFQSGEKQGVARAPFVPHFPAGGERALRTFPENSRIETPCVVRVQPSGCALTLIEHEKQRLHRLTGNRWYGQCSKSNCFRAEVVAQYLHENVGTHARRAVFGPMSNLWCGRWKTLSSAFGFHVHRTALGPKALRH